MVLAHHKMFASHTEQAAGLFMRMRSVENCKSSVTGRFIQGQGKIHPGEAPFRIILPLFGLGLGSSYSSFFTFEALQRSSAVMDQSVQGPPLHFANIFALADYFQIQCGRSKVDDLLQSCQINSGKLRRHFQSLKHTSWPSQKVSCSQIDKSTWKSAPGSQR